MKFPHIISVVGSDQNTHRWGKFIWGREEFDHRLYMKLSQQSFLHWFICWMRVLLKPVNAIVQYQLSLSYAQRLYSHKLVRITCGCACSGRGGWVGRRGARGTCPTASSQGREGTSNSSNTDTRAICWQGTTIYTQPCCFQYSVGSVLMHWCWTGFFMFDLTGIMSRGSVSPVYVCASNSWFKPIVKL